MVETMALDLDLSVFSDPQEATASARSAAMIAGDLILLTIVKWVRFDIVSTGRLFGTGFL